MDPKKDGIHFTCRCGPGAVFGNRDGGGEHEGSAPIDGTETPADAEGVEVADYEAEATSEFRCCEVVSPPVEAAAAC